MDRIELKPNMVRGGGNIVTKKSSLITEGIITMVDSALEKYTGTIDEIPFDYYHMTRIDDSQLIPISEVFEGYSAVVINMDYVNSNWEYTLRPISQIHNLSDLNNAVMNLRYVNNTVVFDRFQSQSGNTSLNTTEINSLRGILVSLNYNNKIVSFEKFEVD